MWLDDEETTYNAGLAIQTTPHEAPVLGVGPDSAIGVSRPQMDLIEDFIHDPPAGPVVRFETAGDGHEGHDASMTLSQQIKGEQNRREQPDGKPE